MELLDINAGASNSTTCTCLPQVYRLPGTNNLSGILRVLVQLTIQTNSVAKHLFSTA
jgi:hypothetical protein